MEKLELKPGIYWVGAIDWDLRNFHGYMTQRGTTYNSYLIVDEKVTLVDTVKHYMFDEMFARIKEIIDPAKIDYIVANHVEMDHTGSIEKLLAHAPNATILTSKKGEAGIRRHFKKDWPFQVVASGDSVSIGKRTLTFVTIPMVHWPDSMVTYIPEDKLLLPNDAFGQHIATSERFDDELPWDILKEEAAKYYANIVLPFGGQVKKALDALSGLDIDMIGPSHGIVWRSYIPKILEEYGKWCVNRTEPRALIVYDSMWGSTERMAHKLQEGLEEAGVHVSLRNLKRCHISDIMTDVLTARLIAVGSPTLNNGMLPTMGAFVTYLKGLRPKNRLGLAFGSYGWSGQAAGQLEDALKEMGFEIPLEKINLNYVPDDDELESVKASGKKLAENILAGGS